MTTPTRTLAPLLLCLAVLAAACRDEQAGPRPKGARPGAARPLTTTAGAPQLTYRSGATLGGGAVRYLGSRVEPPTPTPGQPVTLRHYFQALRQPPEGYAFFVHVVDPATGQMLANADHDFQGGAAPLQRWPVGEVVEDVHTLLAPPASARVLMGFWRGDARLAVDQAQGHDGSDRLLGPPLDAGGPQLPEYRVARAARPPLVDGVLDDAAWKAATPATLVGSFDGRPARLRTEVRLLWDDQHLYAAFDVQDPDVWGTFRERDQPIYEQEVVELFLDANADGRTYNELQVSPHNVTFDAYFPARRQGMDLSWDSGMASAVKVRGTLDAPEDRDTGWSAELRIPLARLAEVPRLPPQPGDRWRFNAYRLEHHGRRDIEGQAFSPLFVGDFHALPRFGWLVFAR